MIWHFCMILGSFIPNRVSQKYLPHSMATHSQSLYQYKPVCTTTHNVRKKSERQHTLVYLETPQEDNDGLRRVVVGRPLLAGSN